VRFDPRRALVGLGVAGLLILTPPAAGYAVEALDGHTGARSHRTAGERHAVMSVLADNDNDEAAVNNGNDNDEGAAPAEEGPPPDPNANNPNNSDGPGNGGSDSGGGNNDQSGGSSSDASY
jgi:hypothetical protein